MEQVQLDDPSESFQYWLANTDEALGRFFEMIPAQLKHQLNYSEASLKPFETDLLTNVPDVETLLSEENLPRLDGTVAYLGETFRKLAGGKWELSDNEPGMLYHNLPVVNGVGLSKTVICPHFLVKAAVKNRRGDKFAKLLRRNLED